MKSQASVEFLIITIGVLFFFTLIFIAIQNNIEDKNKEKEELVIKSLALSIQNEVSLARSSSNGYIRNFSIPENINGKEYNLAIINSRIYINTSNIALSLIAGDVNGTVKKGENEIRKENEKVYLNK